MVPPGEVTFSRSAAASSVERCSISPAPATVSRASFAASAGGRPAATPACGQRFGEQEDIGRPGARYRGDGVHQRSRPRSIRPRRSRPGGVARARAARRRRRARTATVMPRPIAAGVFGMARTSAHGGRQGGGEKLQRPPGHDRHDHGGGDDQSAQAPAGRLRGDLRLHGDDERGRSARSVAGSGLSRTPRRGERGDLRRRLRFDDDEPWPDRGRARSQPSSKAPPILPAPTSTRSPGAAPERGRLQVMGFSHGHAPRSAQACGCR